MAHAIAVIIDNSAALEPVMIMCAPVTWLVPWFAIILVGETETESESSNYYYKESVL